MAKSPNQKSLQVVCTEQRPVMPDKVCLKLQASLVEKMKDGNRRIPNIMFEIRIGVENVYKQQSNSQGILELTNVQIPYQDQSEITIEAKAFDGPNEITSTIQLNIEEGLNSLREAGENLRKIMSGNLTSSEIIKFSIGQDPNLIAKMLLKFPHEKLIKQIQELKEAECAEILLSSLASEHPELVMKNFGQFYDKLWARKIIVIVLEDNPMAVADCIELFMYQPWAKDIFIELADKIPDKLVTEYNRYNHMPFGEKILLSSIRKASPEIVLNNIHICTRKSLVMDLLLKNILFVSPKLIMEKLDLFVKESWAEQVLMHVAEKSPEIAVKNFEKYNS